MEDFNYVQEIKKIDPSSFIAVSNLTRIEGKFVKCFCLYETVEGYNVLAIYPESDAMRSRNISVLITIIAELVVFGLLYAVIYLLVRNLVVKNIDKVNESLSQITAGNLDTVVNVRSQIEFDALSNDINATVDTLKRYIKEAAERTGAGRKDVGQPV